VIRADRNRWVRTVQAAFEHRPVLAGAGIFLCALLPRLIYLLTTRPFFDSPYWTLSEDLLRYGTLGIDGVKTTAFEPGYPAFLAISRRLADDRVVLVQVIQSIVSAAGAVCLHRLATALSGRWQVGVLAAMLFALYPLLIRHSADPTDAALMTTLVMAFAATFVTAAGPARLAAAGVWAGLAVLTRAMALPLILCGAAIEWRNRGWRYAAAFALPALLLVAPYGLRNYALNGSTLPTRSGLNLFISNSAHTATVFPEYGPDILQDYAFDVLDMEMRIDTPRSPSVERDQDAIWTRLAIEQVRQHPLRIAGLKVRNVLYFFSPRLVPYHEPTEQTRIAFGDDGRFAVTDSPPRRLSHELVYAASYTPVLALACAGVWLRRRILGRDAILWCVLVTFVAAHVVYFPMTRYRVPVEFVLLFYAAVTLDRWRTSRTVQLL
jgi:hypothetical protein